MKFFPIIFAYSCRYRSTKTTLKVYFPTPLKRFLCGQGITSDVHGGGGTATYVLSTFVCSSMCKVMLLCVVLLLSRQ